MTTFPDSGNLVRAACSRPGPGRASRIRGGSVTTAAPKPIDATFDALDACGSSTSADANSDLSPL